MRAKYVVLPWAHSKPCPKDSVGREPAKVMGTTKKNTLFSKYYSTSGITMVLRAVKLSLAVNGDVELQRPPGICQHLSPLFSHVFESFERSNLDNFASGLGRKDLLLLGERVDAFPFWGGRLMNDYNLHQTRQSKDSRAFLAHRRLDLV